MMQVISKRTRTGQQLEITVEDNTDGYPVAVIYLDGKRLTDGDVMDSRRAVRPAKMPAACTHIVANKVALPAGEGERLEAALKQARAEYAAAKEQRLSALFPGLHELEAAYDAMETYRDNFRQWLERGDGVNPPQRPAMDPETLRTQYPAAALYLTAKSYETSDNIHKYSAGKQARELLEAGGDLNEARDILKNWVPEHALWD